MGMDEWVKRQKERINNWYVFIIVVVAVGLIVYKSTNNYIVGIMGSIITVLVFMVYDLYPRISELEENYKKLKGKIDGIMKNKKGQLSAKVIIIILIILLILLILFGRGSSI